MHTVVSIWKLVFVQSRMPGAILLDHRVGIFIGWRWRPVIWPGSCISNWWYQTCIQQCWPSALICIWHAIRSSTYTAALLMEALVCWSSCVGCFVIVLATGQLTTVSLSDCCRHFCFGVSLPHHIV